MDLNQLGNLSSAQLQKLFKQTFPRRNVPKVKQLIIAEIAYHVQSRQLGSLDKATQDRLNVCKRQFTQEESAFRSDDPAKRQAAKAKQTVKSQPRITNQLADGTVLKRQFNGRVYEVLVRVENNKTIFLFQDRHYRSLSKIAEEITGCHWSGPRFFGLVKIKQFGQSLKENPERQFQAKVS